MRRADCLLLAPIAAALVAGACTRDHATSPAVEGFVTLVYSTDGGAAVASASAAFFTPGGAPASDFIARPLNVCAAPSTATPTPGPTPTPLDAGATLTLTQGGTTLTLDRATGGGTIVYAGTGNSSTLPLSTTWDFTNAGGPDIAASPLTGALHIPGSLLVASSYTLASSTPMQWTPANANFVILSFNDPAGTPRVRCTVRDDGTFTVPDAMLALLSTSGRIVFAAESVNERSVDRRAVIFSGTTITSSGYTK